MVAFPPLAYARICLVLALLSGLPAAWASSTSTGAMASLIQAEGLPREFEAHFFDVPLAVRIDLDGRYLGDAMVVLSRDGQVQLLEFTDTQDSREPAAARRRWQERLEKGRPLGGCTRDCVDGLRAIHYSLVNSQLSLLTEHAEQEGEVQRFHALPEQGSYGLLVRNQLNLVNSGSATSGGYFLQGQGSLGNWTTLADARFDRAGDSRDGTRYRMEQLYAERLHDEHFFRLGYFTPSAQGLTRQPRLMGSRPDSTVGLMFGSSDSLLVDNGQASSTPVYVTPNRPGVVEIYRNGVLINSQAVQPGLQTLDTRVLPGGIYEVEVRLLEDGQETSRSQAFIYKPSNWSNPENRWRYNVYLGQQDTLLGNWDDDRDASLSAGMLANYLVHPRAVLGASVQQVDGVMQYGTSLDLDPTDRLKVFGNVFRAEGQGDGFDLQLVQNHDLGSLVFSHSRSWLDERRFASHGMVRSRQAREQSQTSVLFNHRLDTRSSATLRVSHATGSTEGLGIDLGWSYYGKLLGSDASWRLSLFDRPGSSSSGEARNRGVIVTMSMSLGQPGQRISASLGSRTSRDGGRDQNASLAYQQDVELGPIHSLGGNLTVDRYGMGLGGNTQFQSKALYGDAYAQRSSYNGEFTGGLNLQSIVGLGSGKVVMSGQYLPYDAGLIIDVDSDMKDLKLRADDQSGLGATLRPGRNIIPVGAYKAGYVQFDFEGDRDPAAVIQPSSLDYHLNRGGVEYRQLHVMRTVTVLGRLLDRQGQAMSGALVLNHASRSVSEPGGYFAVEMSESTPILEIRQDGQTVCLLTLDVNRLEREGDVLLAGDVSCQAEGLAKAQVGR